MNSSTHSKRIYLVRNAEAESNISQKFCGNSTLTKNGEMQAALTGTYLRQFQIGSLFSSPLLHARNTAERIGDELGLEVITDKGLSNVDTGLWEGLTKDEIMNTWPDHWRKLTNDIFNTDDQILPGGEVVEAFFGRVIDSIMRILSSSEEITNTCIVAHNFSIAAILAHTVGASHRGLNRFETYNCSISRIDSLSHSFKLIYSNSICHLEQANAKVNAGAFSGAPTQ